MIQSEISKNLFDLIKTLRDHLDEFRTFENKEVVKHSELHTRSKGKIEEYNKGITKIGWHTEYFVKEDTLWINFKKYFERLSLKYTILEKCKKELIYEFSITEDESLRNIHKLFHLILFKNSETISDERIIELVTVFINDLNKTTPSWKIKLWINGIWLNERVITLSKELSIRQPIDLDFETIEPQEKQHLVHYLDLLICAQQLLK